MGRVAAFFAASIALASGLVGFWRAAESFWAGRWAEHGDGVLFWLCWAEDPGKRRLWYAAVLAAGVLAAAAFSRRFVLLRPAARIVALLGRPWLVLSAVGLAVLPQVAAFWLRPAAETSPNVLFVVLDTVRADEAGFSGGALPTTPRFDALAAGGAAFPQALSQAPWTKPASATLLTGRTPSHHLAVGRSDREFYAALPQDQRTLAEAFARAGYATAGVTTNPNVTHLFGFSQGFFRWVEIGLADAEAVLGQADGLAAAGERPWFVYLHFNDAHYPYQAPPGFLGRFDDSGSDADLTGPSEHEFRAGELDFDATDVRHFRLAHAEEVAYLDDRVGAFVARTLAAQPDTIVVVVADHGEEFLDHGDLGHGHSGYDELLRVPLLIAWGARAGERLGLVAGARIDRPVRSMDLAPTLLELAGLTWPAGAPPLDGRSLAPLLRDPQAPEEPRIGFAETDSDGSLRSGLAGPLRIWRAPPWKLIETDPHSDRAGRYWLFDLDQDPGETRNLASTEPDRVRELALAMQQSGWLIKKALVPGVGVQIPASQREALLALGYIDGEGHLDPDKELPLAPGTVLWAMLPPADEPKRP
ncbi:MAG TPA: sulfatase [Planctomycetota bacterium]